MNGVIEIAMVPHGGEPCRGNGTAKQFTLSSECNFAKSIFETVKNAPYICGDFITSKSACEVGNLIIP